MKNPANVASYRQSHPVSFSQDELLAEEWTPAYQFEDSHLVSNLGRIKTLSREFSVTDKRGVKSKRVVKERILSPYLDTDGYLTVSLSNKGATSSKRVGRLVLESFCPVANMNNLQCNHLDYNRQNDRLSNLEWATALENTRYSTDVYKPNSGPNIPVVDLTSGIHYPSLRAAAIAMTSENAYTTIREAIVNKRLYKGHVWIYEKDVSDSFDPNAYIQFVKMNDAARHSIHCRSVTELKSDATYSTVKAAARSVNGTEAGMLDSIKKHRPYKDSVFVYTDQISDNFDKDKYIVDAYNEYVNPWKKIPVLDLLTGKVYESSGQASRDTGLADGNIRLSIKEKRDCMGHIFTDNLAMTEEEGKAYIRAVKMRSGVGIGCKVKDLTTGEIFPSYEAATKSVNGTGGIQYSIEHKQAYKGHVFIKLSDIDDSFEEDTYVEECIARSLKMARKLVCRETGEQFKSITAASKSFGVSTDVFGLRRENNGLTIVYKGLHFDRTL